VAITTLSVGRPEKSRASKLSIRWSAMPSSASPSRETKMRTWVRPNSSRAASLFARKTWDMPALRVMLPSSATGYWRQWRERAGGGADHVSVGLGDRVAQEMKGSLGIPFHFLPGTLQLRFHRGQHHAFRSGTRSSASGGKQEEDPDEMSP